MFDFRPSNWPYGYTKAGQLPGGGVILRPGISIWPIPGSSLGYFGETETYDGVPQPVPAPAPAPSPIYVAPTPSPIKAPALPPPLPYQMTMETPYGTVKAPPRPRTQVTGSAAQRRSRESVEEAVVRARVEESTYKPEFSVPSRLVPPQAAPTIHEGGVPSLLPVKDTKDVKDAEAPPTLVEPEEKPEQLQAKINEEMHRARQYAIKEARRQYDLGRGGGSAYCGLGFRGSCTEESYALYNAIKAGGPYKYIGFSQVRRPFHSAVAVYPKGRGNKYDSEMIVFDPYQAGRGNVWAEFKASAWQGGLLGMWKYKGSDYTLRDNAP